MKLTSLSILFACGVCLGRFVTLPVWVLGVGLLPLCLSVFKKWRPRAVFLAACAILLLGGAIYYPLSVPGKGPQTLSYYNGRQEVSVRGVITREVERRDTTQHLRVAAEIMDPAGQPKSISGDMLVFVPLFPEYSYGDEITLTGNLDDPPVFTSELTGEVEFDYADYLALKNVYSVMVYPRIEVVSSGNGSPVLEWLYNFRQDLSSSIERAMPEPQASLARGMLLGMRYDIPQPIRDSFSVTGTYHLLAISGLHLSIIAGIILSLCLALFGRRHYLYVWLTGGFIWFYVFVSGAGLPVIRAGIMATVFLLAELLGRQKSALPALGLAAAVMVAVDPKALFTPSFQMSFAAMAGIIVIYPQLRSLFRRFTRRFDAYTRIARLTGAASDGLAVSVAATLAVSPLVAYYFQVFSPLGPLLTLVTLPAVAAVIVFGGLASLAGMVFWPAAAAIGSVCWLAGGYIIKVVTWASGLPSGYSQGVHIPGAFVAGYYLVLVTISLLAARPYIVRSILERLSFIRGHRWQSGRITWRSLCFTAAVCVLLVAGAGLAGCRHDDYLRINFLDVGQGDAILVSAGNQQVLIDGGPSPRAIAGELGRVMPYWDRTIELVVLTHPHADHINGLVEVLDRFQVGGVLYSDYIRGVRGYELSTFEEWREQVTQKAIPATLAVKGQTFNLGRAVFTVLNPPDEPLAGTESDVDNNNVVLNLKAGQFNFLFTGDLMWQGELELILDGQLESGVILKAGHHGSDTSSSAEFLSVSKPGLGIICVGDNNYGHPAPEIVERLEQATGRCVLRADEPGGVTLVTDGARLWLENG